MSPEATTPQTTTKEITVPEALLPAHTDTEAERPAPKLLTVPEGLVSDKGERGIEASEVHDNVSVDLGAQAIAQARIIEKQAEFERVSAEEAESARIAREKANIEE